MCDRDVVDRAQPSNESARVRPHAIECRGLSAGNGWRRQRNVPR
jgi:hypothetical protein